MEELFTPFRVLLFGGLILVPIYVLTSRLSAARARSLLIQQHGCESIPSRRFKDPFFALDGIFQAVQRIKSHTFLEYCRQQYQTYGNTFASQIATMKTINTAEPENFKAILSTHFKDYEVGSPRRNAFEPALGNSLLLVDGAAWEHSRALMRPSFNRNQIGDLKVLETHVQKLIHAIPRDGSTVDLQALFLLFTADVTTDFLFGESIQSLSNPDAFGGDLAQAFKEVQIGAEKRFRFGTLAMFVPNAPFYAAIKKIHAYMDAHVDKAVQSRQKALDKSNDNSQPDTPEKPSTDLNSPPKKYIFLHELALATTDRATLRHELLGIFVAGRDTTATLLSNLFFVLARHPDITTRLRAEIAAQLGGRDDTTTTTDNNNNDEKGEMTQTPPTLDDLKAMPYLTACINETLRLYPIVQGSSRVAIKDTVLPRGGGRDGSKPVLVPRGTLAIYHYYIMHSRTDLWGDDALEFRPERWEEKRKKQRRDAAGGSGSGRGTGTTTTTTTTSSSWDFLPFGGGPRNCIGQQFALLEAGYAAVRLLQRFRRVESRDARPWTESIGATVSSQYGVQVALFE